jgi:hypothetical protein
MRETARRVQLALEWTGAVQWSELPASTRRELCALLRELLWHAADDDSAAGGAPDE